MATEPTASLQRIRDANGNAYDETTNPGGLAQGGHRQNFVPDLNAAADVGEWAADLAEETQVLRGEVAADRLLTQEDASNTGLDRIATAQHVVDAATEAGRAEQEADRAQGYADGLNLPVITEADAGKFLRVAEGGSGYVAEPADDLNFADEATAIAGEDETLPVNSAGVKASVLANAPEPILRELGVNQTWQTVSRALNTSYQNTTGKPIVVSVRLVGQGSTARVEISTDNSTWVLAVSAWAQLTDPNNGLSTAQAIVPDSHYYRFVGTGNPTIQGYVELR